MNENEKVKRYFRKGRQIRSVTWAPGFIELFRGYMDSFKGENVALAHLNQRMAKCELLEYRECLEIENTLIETRKEAAQLISSIKDNKGKLQNVGSPGDDINSDSHEVYMNISRDLFTGKINAVKSRLTRMWEFMEHAHEIFDNRIGMTRDKAKSRSINRYVKGLTVGKLKDFKYEPVFQARAVESYYARHAALDENIDMYAHEGGAE